MRRILLRKRKMVMTGFYSDVNGVDGKVEQVDGGGESLVMVTMAHC